MGAFMLLLAVLAGLLGVATFGTATSALHEAIAGLFWVIAAVLLGSAGVINAVDRLRSEVRRSATPGGAPSEPDRDSPSGVQPLQ